MSQRGRLFLGQIRQNAEAKTEIGPPLSDRALYSDKARSFNQSERALYRNFIIILNKSIFLGACHSATACSSRFLYLNNLAT